MKLPNGHLAVVEQAKVCEYLLNPAHPDFKRIKIGKLSTVETDPRLIRILGVSTTNRLLRSRFDHRE